MFECYCRKRWSFIVCTQQIFRIFLEKDSVSATLMQVLIADRIDVNNLERGYLADPAK